MWFDIKTQGLECATPLILLTLPAILPRSIRDRRLSDARCGKVCVPIQWLSKEALMAEKDVPENRVDVNKHCHECGSGFYCAGYAGQAGCWCADLPRVMPVRDKAAKCLCPHCLRKRIDARLGVERG